MPRNILLELKTVLTTQITRYQEKNKDKVYKDKGLLRAENIMMALDKLADPNLSTDPSKLQFILLLYAFLNPSCSSGELKDNIIDKIIQSGMHLYTVKADIYQSPYFSEDDIGDILEAHRIAHRFERCRPILPTYEILQRLLTQLYQQIPKPTGSVDIAEAAKPFRHLVQPDIKNRFGKWRRALFGNNGESKPVLASLSEELTPILRQ